MLQVEDPILYFLLLVLGILLNLGLDIRHKQDRFSKTLPEKGLKFVPNRKRSTVFLNLGLILLLVKVNLILDK